MSLAPVVLFVYNRPWHTQQTIEALRKNDLAGQSGLFIFSDGPKNETDVINVQKVRDYLKTVTGFKEITIVEREKNVGLAKSIISGVTGIIDKYGKIIVMEDDLVSSPGLLNFLNDGLDFYKDDKNIFCITGYNFPSSIMKIPKGYPHEVYVSPRNGSWGWATWKNRWDMADWDVSDYPQFSVDKHLQDKFNRGGEDLCRTLQSQREGKIDSWAVRWCYSMFKSKGYCIYPVNSFIDTIGCDGTGVHSGTDRLNRMKNFILNGERKIQFTEKIEIDDEIMDQFRGIFKKKNLVCMLCEYGKALNLKFFTR